MTDGAMRPAGKTVVHPARYSPEVISLLRWLLKARTRIHDPFAGTGERLGSMADDRALIFTGTDIEPAFIVDPRVVEGDATDPASYPPAWLCTTCGDVGGPGMHLDKRPLVADPAAAGIEMCRDHDRRFTIVTSPVYPNGMCDHFVSTDPARDDKTYRSAAAKILSQPSYELDERNMGRWGYRGRKLSSPGRMMYWHLAEASVECWSVAERVIVNVSDFVEQHDRTIPVVAEWQRLLIRQGWVNQDVHVVPTRRYGKGSNRDNRAANEVVIDAHREVQRTSPMS